MKTLAFTIFSLLLGLSTPAFAAEDCSAQFRKDGEIIVRALMKRGYSNFGPLRFSEIIRQMNSDAITVIPGTGLLGRQDLRSTARWKREGRKLTVQVDCAWYNKFSRMERSVLALHDFAWSLGYDDEKYYISLGAWLLTQPVFHESLRTDEVSNFKGHIDQIAVASRSGGVVGVGGGGEIYTVACKLGPILDSLKTIREAQSQAERERGEKLFSYFFARDLNCIPGHRLDGQ